MWNGSHKGPDKPNKGIKGGACNRSRCQEEPANWYNRGSLAYYCGDYARVLNNDTFNKKEALRMYNGPLCIEER